VCFVSLPARVQVLTRLEQTSTLTLRLHVWRPHSGPRHHIRMWIATEHANSSNPDMQTGWVFADIYVASLQTGPDSVDQELVHPWMAAGSLRVSEVYPLVTARFSVPFAGIRRKLAVPSDVAAVLKRSYGEQYMISDVQWDWITMKWSTAVPPSLQNKLGTYLMLPAIDELCTAWRPQESGSLYCAIHSPVYIVVITAAFPLVSVTVPTYQRRLFLLKALEMVERQDYPNLEVIIVDDSPVPSLSETEVALLARAHRRVPVVFEHLSKR